MSRRVTEYPLCWPIGRIRTPAKKRKRSTFGRKADSGYGRKAWTITMAMGDLVDELRRMGAKGDYVISLDVPRRADGGLNGSYGEPEDPGVAVYFRRRINVTETRAYAMACDQYDRVADNCRALVLTIEALRKIERHGSSDLMEQAFSGFAELPAARTTVRPWDEVLGLDLQPTDSIFSVRERCKMRHRELCLRHHPDRGGDHDTIAEINEAYDRATAALDELDDNDTVGSL